MLGLKKAWLLLLALHSVRMAIVLSSHRSLKSVWSHTCISTKID